MQTAKNITSRYTGSNGIRAFVSVNKALVTQASAAIPVVPLYLSVLYKVMKEKGLHEGCIEQMDRLYRDKIYISSGIMAGPEEAEAATIHVDDYEMRPEVQKEVMDIWEKINSDNLLQLADTDGYWLDFYHMFGFKVSGVDYSLDVEV